MDSDLKRELIMEHYMNPLNRETIDDPKYLKVRSKAETCIDDINLYVLIEDNIIKDIHFDGEACAISTSATSIMTKLIKNKTVEEVKELIKEYYKMIDGEEHNEDLLEEAICYDEIYKQENRKGCATIPWRGLEKAIQKYETENAK